MTGENAHLRLVLRTEACRTAALIRQLEEVSSGAFGEAGAVLRQAAAGDEVASDDLVAALASVRLTLRDAVTILERIISSEPGRT
jgi:hypothetical protein